MFFLGFQPKKNLVPENLKHTTGFGARHWRPRRGKPERIFCPIIQLVGRSLPNMRGTSTYFGSSWSTLSNTWYQHCLYSQCKYTYQMMFNFSALHWWFSLFVCCKFLNALFLFRVKQASNCIGVKKWQISGMIQWWWEWWWFWVGGL